MIRNKDNNKIKIENRMRLVEIKITDLPQPWQEPFLY